MRLSVNLVSWNGAKYIPHLFNSLRQQTFKDWRLLVLDNGSADGTVELIKKEMNNLGVQAELVEGEENLGFAAGHNRLFKCYMLHDKCYMLHDICYMMLLNQDMYLMPDCLEKLVKFMDEHPEAAAVSPRLMRWDFNKLQVTSYKFQESFTNQIDSLGLKIFRNRRVVELHAGQNWQDVSVQVFKCSSVQVIEVFGVSGALPLFRRSVIDKVGLFDESFGSYKEDVDLAFRLRSAGCRSFVVLDAMAYHDRSASGLSDLSDKTALANKKKQSDWVKYNSYKNHLITLYKNEYWQNFWLDFPWIFWYELKKFVYFLVFDRKVLRGLGEIFKRLKDLKIKRLEIKKMRKIGWKEMREWLDG